MQCDSTTTSTPFRSAEQNASQNAPNCFWAELHQTLFFLGALRLRKMKCVRERRAGGKYVPGFPAQNAAGVSAEKICAPRRLGNMCPENLCPRNTRRVP